MSFLLAHHRDSSSSLISMQCCAPRHKIPAVTASLLLEACVPNMLRKYSYMWLWPWIFSLFFGRYNVFPVMLFYLTVTTLSLARKLFGHWKVLTRKLFPILQCTWKSSRGLTKWTTISSLCLQSLITSLPSSCLLITYEVILPALNTKQLTFRVFPPTRWS